MSDKSILVICLNPVLQKTLVFSELAIDKVNRTENHFFDIAGKGIHVARVIKQLGGRAQLLTQCGGRFREMFLEQAQDEEIHLLPIFTRAELRFCYTLIDRSAGTITECVEEGSMVESHLEYEVMQSLMSHLDEADVVVISGSKAPGFSEKLYPVCVKQAKDKNKQVVLDIRGKDLLDSLPFKPDVLKINREEFAASFWGNKESGIDQIKEKMLELYEEFGVISIITHGADEVFYTANAKVKTAQPPSLNSKNSVGCGDAFTAALALGLASKQDVSGIVDFAMETAGKAALLIRPGRIFD
ncbi:MAG: tagatose-6-phosphate kinase [Spirochaetales bacterium]|nr:tagatose-6-phosphate kinase [Spirochaetales bacterium]